MVESLPSVFDVQSLVDNEGEEEKDAGEEEEWEDKKEKKENLVKFLNLVFRRTWPSVSLFF